MPSSIQLNLPPTYPTFASLAPSNIAASFTGPGWVTSILVVVATLLVLEQSVYRYKKAHLPGAKWTIPVIGKFAGEFGRAGMLCNRRREGGIRTGGSSLLFLLLSFPPVEQEEAIAIVIVIVERNSSDKLTCTFLLDPPLLTPMGWNDSFRTHPMTSLRLPQTHHGGLPQDLVNPSLGRLCLQHVSGTRPWNIAWIARPFPIILLGGRPGAERERRRRRRRRRWRPWELLYLLHGERQLTPSLSFDPSVASSSIRDTLSLHTLSLPTNILGVLPGPRHHFTLDARQTNAHASLP